MNFCKKIIFFLALLIFLLPLNLLAEKSNEVLKVSAKVSTINLAKGDKANLILTLKIKEPFHVNANPSSFDYLIPTSVAIEKNNFIEFGAAKYPEGILMKVGGFDTAIKVYGGKIIITIPLQVSKVECEEKIPISGKVRFQACDENSCYAPSETGFEAEVIVRSEKNPGTLSIVSETSSNKIANNSQIVNPKIPENNSLNRSQFAGRSLFVLIILSFIGGLSLNLTPCVYPLIPVTAGYFSRQAGGKKKTFLLALTFIFSMAIVYSLLGVAAAFTGSLFGRALQHPVVLVFISSIMFFLALAMFGVYEIRMPTGLSFLTESRPGVSGAAFMGATMGVVAAPCVGPFIAALLAFVGAKGDPLQGFVLFFSLGIGMGIPYIPLALIAESFSRMPKAGPLLVTTKRILGFFLIVLSAWFLLPIIGERIFSRVLILISIAGGIILFLFGAEGEGQGTLIFRKIGSALLIVFALVKFFEPAESQVKIDWHEYTQSGFAEAISGGRAVIIDFSASWCLPCREMDAVTFSEPTVIEELSKHNIAAFRADVSGPNISAEVDALVHQFGIRGVPTVIFFDGRGNEISDLRLTGFEGPNDFIKRLAKISLKEN